MIDWVTAVLPCHHDTAINGGRIVKVSKGGEVQWQTEHRFEVKGSHETNIFVKTIDDGLLEITGNPVKFIQGHNLWGTDDLAGLVFELMTRLTEILELSPTEADMNIWADGDYQLRRVDLTNSYSLKSRPNVRAWLRSAEHSAYLRNRGRWQLTKNSTLYFGENSRRWAIKLYSKGDEIEAHQLPLTIESAFPALADGSACATSFSRIAQRSLALRPAHSPSH